MVVDSSALIAILRLEPGAEALLRAVADAERCCISALNLLETAMVLAGRGGDEGVWAPLDEFLVAASIEIVPFDAAQARLARAAFLRFGKGRHPASLNLGDCAAYALAVGRSSSLLYKGEDFARTDIQAALPA